jgi:hypothetical protein
MERAEEKQVKGQSPPQGETPPQGEISPKADSPRAGLQVKAWSMKSLTFDLTPLTWPNGLHILRRYCKTQRSDAVRQNKIS